LCVAGQWFLGRTAVGRTLSICMLQECDTPMFIYIDPAVTPDPSGNSIAMVTECCDSVTSQPASKSAAAAGPGVGLWRGSSMLSNHLGLSPLTPR
jgi:hypothetical protein